MATNRPPSPPPQRPVKRKRSSSGDNFWLMVTILAILGFTASFLTFYYLTNRVTTRPISLASAPTMLGSASQPPAMMLGNGPTPAASPSVIASASVDPQASRAPLAVPSGAMSSEPSSAPTTTPTVAATVAAVEATPEPVPSPEEIQATVAPTKAPDENASLYRVQVGTYSDRDEAQMMAEKLSNEGYNVVLLSDGDTTHVQLGAFSDKQKAINLADEVTKKGYSVIVRSVQ